MTKTNDRSHEAKPSAADLLTEAGTGTSDDDELMNQTTLRYVPRAAHAAAPNEAGEGSPAEPIVDRQPGVPTISDDERDGEQATIRRAAPSTLGRKPR